MRKLAMLGLAMLALAGGARASGDSFGFTASLAGAGKAHAAFGVTLTGTSLSWKLTFTGPAVSAGLAGTKLCGPCSSPARGKLTLTTAQAPLLQHRKATGLLRTRRGLLTGKVALLAVTGQGGSAAATATKPAPSSDPAGGSWSATAVAADTSAVCLAAVMTGDILLQAAGVS